VSRIALQIEDRTFAVARDGAVLHSSPAVAFDGAGTEPVGTDAWTLQRRVPTHVSTRHLHELATATELSERALAVTAAEFARRVPPHLQENESVWASVSALFAPPGLAAVLAVARQRGVRIAGFIDSATATVAALAPGRPSFVLEIGLHHVAVTAVEASASARRRRAVVSTRGGLVELYESWLNLIGSAMVKRTRYDPLHDAATEQQLFDALPKLAGEANETGGTTAVVTAGADRFESALSRDQFAAAAEPVYREIMRAFNDLRHAGAAATIVVPRMALDMPGLREKLETLRNCELIGVADGFGAAAASVIDIPAAEPAEADAVRLLRRAPALRNAALEALAEAVTLGDPVQEQDPSHVLFEGRAFPLDRGPLLVGRGGEAASGLALPEGLAGISRRHCTFLRDGERLVLVDHSAFGTFVNGERVIERVRLRAGDRVRLGEPGVELALIAVGA
jgi:hypothetical protein